MSSRPQQIEKSFGEGWHARRKRDRPLLFQFGRLGRYGFAFGTVLLALVVTLFVKPLHEQPPTLLFFTAVILTSWYAGLAAGFVASILSIGALDYYFVRAISSGQMELLDFIDFGAFAGVGCLASVAQDRWRQAHRSLVEVEDEISVARRIQLRLFPSAAPAAAGFEIAGSCIPASATGGDFYDYIPMPGGTLGISIGDVSSHGLGPALVMALIRAYLRALALTQADPGIVLSEANQILCDDLEEGRFATVLLCALDPGTQTLSYSSAGHEGFVVDDTGLVATLTSTGLPLGIDGSRPTATGPSVALKSGQIVLLMSDGIVEAESAARELFGLPRAVEVVRAHAQRPAQEIVSAVFDAAHDFGRHAAQKDDMTVVVIKVV